MLQGGTNQTHLQRLQQVRDSCPRSLIIDLDFEAGQSMSDNDPVHFYDKGKDHRMTLGEVSL